MSNHIRKTTLEIRRLSAVEAEVWIRVEVERVTPATEVRGKLMGPRCPGITTVEIAYPLLPLPRASATEASTIIVRTVIDEPNMWSEKSPFVYEGTVELFEDGSCLERAPVSVGLKLA